LESRRPRSGGFGFKFRAGEEPTLRLSRDDFSGKRAEARWMNADFFTARGSRAVHWAAQTPPFLWPGPGKPVEPGERAGQPRDAVAPRARLPFPAMIIEFSGARFDWKVT
jgi:hypothetical protein